MKQLFFILIIYTAFLNISHAQKFGFKTGVNVASFEFSEDIFGEGKQSLIGYHLGIRVKSMVGTNLNFSPSLSWTMKGFKSFDQKQIGQYLELHLPMGYQFDFGMFLELGFAPSLLLETNDNWQKDETNTFDLALLGSLGCIISERIEFKASLTKGLLNLVKDENVDGFSVTNNVWQIGLVYYPN